RIAAEWVGLHRGRPTLLAIDSSRRRTAKRAGSGRTRRTVYHWDIGVVYELRISRLPAAPRAWAEWRFVSRTEWKKIKIGRAHRDLLVYAR
ncbi:MAG: hypothetical protein L3K06_08340, partial [Thermoplasmata archaeon]|nr:hypothetical protein [Thermoplasmata archaeon]